MSGHRAKRTRYSISVISLLCICLFFATKASADEGTPMYRHRVSEIFSYRGTYRGLPEAEPQQKIYEEPLYAYANESARVFRPEKVAIIGGGASGVAIAHFFSDEHGYSPKVTIFEREQRLGGRIHTVRFNDDQTVEAGGSAFDAWDNLMQQQTKDAYANITDVHQGKSPLAFVSTWDGQELSLSEESQITSRYDSMSKMLWHRGLSPRTWKHLWREIWESESGIDYLLISWMTSMRKDESRRWLQPRKERLQKFARAWGLATEPEKEASVSYGMENLLRRSIRIAGSSLNLNATVTRIKRYKDATFDVHWTHIPPDESQGEHVERFDAVIIAAPFHQTDIEIDPPLPVAPEEIKYKPLYVTHFTSESLLDPTTFNLSPSEKVPDVIWDLRNLRQNESELNFPNPSFLTLTRRVSDRLSGCLRDSEYVYRVTSEQPFTDDNIATLINKTGVAHKDLSFPKEHCRHLEDPREKFAELEDQGADEYVMDAVFRTYLDCKEETTVRWVHRRFWPNAVAITHGNSTDSMQRIELAPRLYYVSDFEQKNGASITQSVKSAYDVAWTLYNDYLSNDHC